MNSFDILVIILSITLAIFLVVSIILGINLIKLSKQAQEIMVKADDIIDDVESVSNFVRKTATSVTAAGVIGNIISMVTNHKKKGK